MKYPKLNDAGLTDEQVEAIRDCMSQTNGSESKIGDHNKEIVIYENGGRYLILKIVKSGFQFNVWFHAPKAQKVDKPYKRLKEYLLSKGANDWRFNSAGMELVAKNKEERNGEDRGNVLYFWPQDEALRTRLSGEEIYNRREALGELSKLILEKLKDVNYFTVDYSTLPLADVSGDKYEKHEVADQQKKGILDSSLVDKVLELVKDALNVVLTGAPGTGKTYTAREVAKMMVAATMPKEATEAEKEKAKEERIASIQFHPGYDYSDFVIGMKPVLLSENGEELEMKEGGYVLAKGGTIVSDIRDAKVSFRWKDGVFKKFADDARKAYEAAKDKKNAPNFVFLIDEINRADLSRVFGELFSLLEEEYRYPNYKGTDFILLPNGDRFSIPKNLYIIGTMNDIDRSVESMDFALRRRFAWYEVTADKSASIIDVNVQDSTLAGYLKDAMGKLNTQIADPNFRLGSEYQLGGAIFAKFEKYYGKTPTPYIDLWNNHIKNILSEYLRGRSDRKERLEQFRKTYNEALPNEHREKEFQKVEGDGSAREQTKEGATSLQS